MAIHVVRPGEGERSGGGSIKVRVMEDGTHTSHRLALVEASVPMAPVMPPQHVHRSFDETVIVTAGKVRFLSGEEVIDAEAGTLLVIPAGTAHTFANPFDEAASLIGAFTPDDMVHYFRDLAQLPADGSGQLSPQQIGEALARHDSFILPPAN
jgi:quercetin dioxygenase-like cupin family protein